MTHPLVTQLRFTRSEWIRGLKPVTGDEADKLSPDAIPSKSAHRP